MIHNILRYPYLLEFVRILKAVLSAFFRIHLRQSKKRRKSLKTYGSRVYTISYHNFCCFRSSERSLGLLCWRRWSKFFSMTSSLRIKFRKSRAQARASNSAQWNFLLPSGQNFLLNCDKISERLQNCINCSTVHACFFKYFRYKNQVSNQGPHWQVGIWGTV